MDNGVHDAQRLKELQALPLNRKIQITQTRIIEWYQHFKGQVCVSFSGGKDSTVLMDIARQIYPDIPAVFSNTGLEYPEIQKFVKTYDNVDIIVPEMRFDQVVSTYGYPLIGKEVAHAIYYSRRIKNSNRQDKEMQFRRHHFGATKRDRLSGNAESTLFDYHKWLPIVEMPFMITHYCCNKMKKQPVGKYQRSKGYHPIIATLAEESILRRQAWIKTGCNAFDTSSPKSQPMSFWTEHDVLQYLCDYGIKIASVYGEIVGTDEKGNDCPLYDMEGNIAPKLKCTGCSRTGCIFCGFGFHLDKGQTRFQRLAKTHPRQYEYAIGGGQWVDNPAYDPTAPEYDGEWKNWNPKQIWVPSKKGLGMGKVFEMVNEVYGKDFYKYE